MKMIASATSSAVAMRCSGTDFTCAAKAGLSAAVSVRPGETAFTRMPSGPHSSASVRVRLTTPARAAPECAIPGAARCQMSAITLTTAPLRALNAGKRLRARWKEPVRLVSTTARQPLGLISAAAALNWPPALLTRRSRPSCAARSPSSAMRSQSRTSPGKVRTVPPAAWIEAAAWSSTSARRPTRIRL